MELPIGFRVSGPFLRKGPIIEEGPLAEPKGPLERGLGTRPRVYMRGDYYVVPPNGARIHVGAPDYRELRITHGPDEPMERDNKLLS